MKNILFLNHKQKKCGVYQYGYRMFRIISKSDKYNFIYCEVENEKEFMQNILIYQPLGIIYNHHHATMGWIKNDVILKLKNIKHYAIHHEENITMNILFDYFLLSDCSQVDSDNKFAIPRPIFENNIPQYSPPQIPTIGSFGFGFNNKGFDRLCRLVNQEFDEAVIRLHISFSHYGDSNGYLANSIISKCLSLLSKKKVNLVPTHHFLTDEEVLDFLSKNTLNAFLYDSTENRGLSSVIDYALSVKVPIAITNTNMFRHISDTTPSICVENKTLKQIIKSGTESLEKYREKWSNRNLIDKFEYLLNITIS